MVFRRHFLKSGTALLAAGTTLSLSGCAGILNESDGPGYANWMYAPGAIEDRDRYSFTYLNASEFGDNEDELGDWYTLMKNSAESTLEPAGVGFEDLDSLLGISPVTVCTGSFDTNGVTASLEDSGFTEESEHEGNAIYVGPEGARAFGVSDDAVTVASNDGGGEDVLTTAIDANDGNGDRYVDEDEDMKALSDAVGERTYVNGRTRTEVESTDTSTGLFEGEVANGGGFDVNDDTTELKVALVFGSADDVATDDVEEWVDGESFANVEDAEVSTSDRVVTVTGTANTSEFFG